MAQEWWSQDETVQPAKAVTTGVEIPKAPDKPKEAPSGYRYNAQGNLEIIPGGPADPNAPKPGDSKPTEAQQKTLMLLTRIAGGSNDIKNVLSTSPEAAQSGIFETLSRDVLGEGLITRKLAGSDRRIITDAQGDVLDALLTMGTGAAYNEEQKIANRIAYFPQYDDTQEEIKVKRDRLDRAIKAARIAAGPLAADFDKIIAPLMNVVEPNVQRDAQGREVVAPEIRVAEGAEFSTDTDFQRQRDNSEAWAATQGLPFDQALAQFNATMQSKGYGPAGPETIEVLRWYEENAPGNRAAVEWALPKTGVREAAAPGRAEALGAGLLGGYTGSLAEEIVQQFDPAAAAKLQAAKEYSRENFPGTTLTGEIIGGIMSPINKIIPGAPAAAPMKEAVIQTAKQGALYGGTAGFGEAAPDAGFVERIPGAVIGAATGGATGAAAQRYVTPAVTQFTERYVAPMVQKVLTPTANEAIAAAESAAIPMLTSDVARPKTWFGNWVQQTLEKVPVIGTGGARAAQREAREAAVTKLYDDFAGGTAEIDDVTRDFLKVRGEQIGRLTRQKGEVIDGVSANPIDVTDAVAVIDQNIAKYGNLANYQPLVAKLQSFKSDLLSGDIRQVELVRKVIGDALGDDTLKPVSSELKKVVNDLYPALREDMGRHIQKFGKAGDFSKWRAANEALSDFATDLENATVKRVLAKGNATPEEARLLLFSKKPSEVRALFSGLSEEGKKNARALIIQDMVEKAGGIDDLSVAKFTRQLKDSAKKIGVAFEKDEADRLTGLLKALQSTRRADQAAVNTPTGQALIPLLASGGLGAYFAPGTSAILGTVVAGARMFESKAVKNLLVALSRTAPGSKAEQNVLGSLAKALTTQAGMKGGEAGATEKPMAPTVMPEQQ